MSTIGLLHPGLGAENDHGADEFVESNRVPAAARAAGGARPDVVAASTVGAVA